MYACSVETIGADVPAFRNSRLMLSVTFIKQCRKKFLL